MDFEALFAWCKDHKDELLAAQDAGDSTARTIITTHDLYVRHPDRIALVLLECGVEDYQKRHDNLSCDNLSQGGDS